MYWLGELLAFIRVPTPSIKLIQLVVSLLVILIPLPVLFAFYYWSRPRQALVPPYRERVLILGASSGVGKELALQYASRGCRSIALVGRRVDLLNQVVEECQLIKKRGEEWEMSEHAPGWDDVDPEIKRVFLSIPADCSNAQDVDRVRSECKAAFKGIDTIHICFGLSALRPLLGIAGIDPVRKIPRAEIGINHGTPSAQVSDFEADVVGLETVKYAFNQIHQVNVTATGMVLTAFLPLLQTLSPSPSIHLLGSIAACIPAPTRSLYGASKAAQLILFQSLALEADSQYRATRSSKTPRARVRFLATLPGTILSDFRSSAIDGSPESSGAIDDTWSTPGSSVKGGDGLTCQEVALKSILAIDRFLEGTREMPFKYAIAKRVAPLVPSILAKMAHKKYNY